MKVKRKKDGAVMEITNLAYKLSPQKWVPIEGVREEKKQEKKDPAENVKKEKKDWLLDHIKELDPDTEFSKRNSEENLNEELVRLKKQ